MSNKSIDKKYIDHLIKLFREGQFLESLKLNRDLIQKYNQEPFLYNFKGMIEIKLNEFDSSIQSFNKALKLKPDYVEALNNLSTSYINKGLFNEAISVLKQAISLRNNYSNAYNNLGSALNDLGQYEEALKNFNLLMETEPNYPGVKESIIKILTFYSPKNKELNDFTKINDSLNKINIDDDLSDSNIIKFYNKCKSLVSNKLDNLNFNFSQIWRRNNVDLNCRRHFDVFRNFNVIPEFCFGCFKVQIDVISLLDLFKLYFIFDKLSLNNNRSRKCLVEMRTIGTGSYKGLIYCDGYDEAKHIYNIIKKTTNKVLKENTKVHLRRGCTEFGIAYPEYKKIDDNKKNFMKYKKEWKTKEEIIDSKIPKLNRNNQRRLSDTIMGMTLNDFLIMKNWIMYAKKIDDEDYKKFDENIKISKYMEIEMSKQLIHRKKEFSSLLSK